MSTNNRKARKKRATITDVAKEAGVSIKTVSRVVHKEPAVRSETREKVLKVIKELRYHPRPAGRSSTGERSYLLGFIYDNPSAGYLSELQRGALKAARAEGYHLVIEPCDAEAYNAAEELRILIEQSNLDGVILSPPVCDNRRILNALQEDGIPFSRIAPSSTGKAGFSVLMDDEAAAFAMTSRLIELGHKKIAFIKGRARTSTTRKRERGYSKAVKEIGLETSSQYIVQGALTFKSGFEVAEHLFAMKDRPTAIFASNDEMAAGVIAATYKHGLSVPNDISVAGFDDAEIASAIWPQLTTIKQPIADMSKEAVRILISGALRSQTESQPGERSRMLPFELVERQSTGPLLPL